MIFTGDKHRLCPVWRRREVPVRAKEGEARVKEIERGGVRPRENGTRLLA
jgi:hypothetical protein